MAGKRNPGRVPSFFVDRTGNDRINAARVSGCNGGFDEIDTALPCVGVHLSRFNRCRIERTDMCDRRTIEAIKALERQMTKSTYLDRVKIRFQSSRRTDSF